jgi:hypothetical protein
VVQVKGLTLRKTGNDVEQDNIPQLTHSNLQSG